MSGVICLRHSNVHFPQKNILLASCSRKHTKQRSVGLLGQYYPWAKSALNSSHLSGMLEWVSSQLHLLRQVSITVKVFCILLRLKAIILQLDHVPLKVVEVGVSYFGTARSSRLGETEIWWDFSGILLTSLWVIHPPGLSFLFLMYFSLTLVFQTNQTGPTSGTLFSFFYQGQFNKLYLFLVLKEGNIKQP